MAIIKPEDIADYESSPKTLIHFLIDFGEDS